MNRSFSQIIHWLVIVLGIFLMIQICGSSTVVYAQETDCQKLAEELTTLQAERKDIGQKLADNYKKEADLFAPVMDECRRFLPLFNTVKDSIVLTKKIVDLILKYSPKAVAEKVIDGIVDKWVDDWINEHGLNPCDLLEKFMKYLYEDTDDFKKIMEEREQLTEKLNTVQHKIEEKDSELQKCPFLQPVARTTLQISLNVVDPEEADSTSDIVYGDEPTICYGTLNANNSLAGNSSRYRVCLSKTEVNKGTYTNFSTLTRDFLCDEYFQVEVGAWEDDAFLGSSFLGSQRTERFPINCEAGSASQPLTPFVFTGTTLDGSFDYRISVTVNVEVLPVGTPMTYR